MSKEKIVVTGGAGFIGSHVAELLLKNGYEVIVIDDLSNGLKENLPSGARFYRTDISDKESVFTVFHKFKPKAVLHLAAHIDVASSFDNPMLDARSNIIGTINLINASIASKVQKFVFSSSAAVYGEPKSIPVKEDSFLMPLSPYGASKSACEDYVRVLCNEGNIEWLIFRLSNVYGPRQAAVSDSGVIPIFIKSLINKKEVKLYDKGEMIRDFIYVSDVADAFLKSLQRGKGIYNISSGNGYKIKQIYQVISDILNFGKARYEQSRRGEIKKMVMQKEKAAGELEWQPEVELKKGLNDTVRYWRERTEK